MAITKILIKMNLSEEIKFCGEIICSNREGEREREEGFGIREENGTVNSNPFRMISRFI